MFKSTKGCAVKSPSVTHGSWAASDNWSFSAELPLGGNLPNEHKCSLMRGSLCGINLAGVYFFPNLSCTRQLPELPRGNEQEDQL